MCQHTVSKHNCVPFISIHLILWLCFNKVHVKMVLEQTVSLTATSRHVKPLYKVTQSSLSLAATSNCIAKLYDDVQTSLAFPHNTI